MITKTILIRHGCDVCKQQVARFVDLGLLETGESEMHYPSGWVLKRSPDPNYPGVFHHTLLCESCIRKAAKRRG